MNDIPIEKILFSNTNNLISNLNNKEFVLLQYSRENENLNLLRK